MPLCSLLLFLLPAVLQALSSPSEQAMAAARRLERSLEFERDDDTMPAVAVPGAGDPKQWAIQQACGLIDSKAVSQLRGPACMTDSAENTFRTEMGDPVQLSKYISKQPIAVPCGLIHDVWQCHEGLWQAASVTESIKSILDQVYAHQFTSSFNLPPNTLCTVISAMGIWDNKCEAGVNLNLGCQAPSKSSALLSMGADMEAAPSIPDFTQFQEDCNRVTTGLVQCWPALTSSAGFMAGIFAEISRKTGTIPSGDVSNPIVDISNLVSQENVKNLLGVMKCVVDNLCKGPGPVSSCVTEAMEALKQSTAQEAGQKQAEESKAQAAIASGPNPQDENLKEWMAHLNTREDIRSDGDYNARKHDGSSTILANLQQPIIKKWVGDLTKPKSKDKDKSKQEKQHGHKDSSSSKATDMIFFRG